MASEKLEIGVEGQDAGHLYAFNNQGDLISHAPVSQGTAVLAMPAEIDGHKIEIIFGPPIEKLGSLLTAATLKRIGAPVRPGTFLLKEPRLEWKIPEFLLPKWCLCQVRGKLIKRFTLPDGTTAERPVCNTRVHICEIDRIRFIIPRIPDQHISRLRDELLEKLQVIPQPFPHPPEPKLLTRVPDLSLPVTRLNMLRNENMTLPLSSFTADQHKSVLTLATTRSITQWRNSLIDLSELIAIHLCDLIWLWPFFSKDCLATANTDDQGHFSAVIFHRCSDRPDIYLWVEQFQQGVWQTVYKPGIGCGTYWNYTCGTDIVINLPHAIACEEQTYDIPPGVTLFVLPFSVGNAPVWGIPAGSPPAPDGWIRPDGYINYYDSSFTEMLHNAPFGGTLHFRHDDSYFIPDASGRIKYYRYSFRRKNLSSQNTGAADPSWTPIRMELTRGYRIEYSDRLPTYEAYLVGPFTVGTQAGLFEFKPQTPPVRATDPATVVAREWTSGNLSEHAASWDTLPAVPPLSIINTTDNAGDFEIKIEVFDKDGHQVIPGTSTFQFLARNADGTTTRYATSDEIAGGAYIMTLHIDNNPVYADLPQPSVNGTQASDDCGFLRYTQGIDPVHIAFAASHPNDHAVFVFTIKRGSNELPVASTQPPYTETGAITALTYSSSYIMNSGFYQQDFTATELTGNCINAAFASNLAVYGKVTDGYQRLGLDASKLIAFALAEQGFINPLP